MVADESSDYGFSSPMFEFPELEGLPSRDGPRIIRRSLKGRPTPNTVSEALQLIVDDLSANHGVRLSVRQLAEDSGSSPRRVAATLSGERVPTRQELDLLCMALGVSSRDREIIQRFRTREETARAHHITSAVEAGQAAVEEILRDTRVPLSGIRPVRERQQQPARTVRERQPVPKSGQPDPILVSNREELAHVLKAVHVWGGAPSLRELERRSKGVLRRSTISDMLRGTTLPDYERYIVFLKACGIDEPSLDTWVFVWRRLKALEAPGASRWLPGTDSVA
ncbi:helix-turn-helix domain-containing protein [Streptomyces galbus]|uniref:Helix-turn-helix transcriptional regulator n=1 Tax=Streptomyces galbus TaxID=33898 RepID=A0ABX1ITH5_STRGB|nr:helix-turn-helix transcriptional regulator [Streptomyces galbus]NKQ27581.1 helix-turn-helix transcriptional regulator [Streptomyces galbus]